MTDLLTQRLHDTAERIPVALRPASETRRAAEHAHRRRLVVATAASAVVVAVVASAALGAGRDTSESVLPVGTPSPSASRDVALPVWLGGLPAGEPPMTPYWHDGVLHVPGGDIETPFPVGSIEVAGDTVLIGGKPDENYLVADAEWALVRGDRLVPIPAPAVYGMGLSVDGRIAFWESPTPGIKRFVTWDTETNTELATRDVPGSPGTDFRLMILGIDADGIAYWVDEASDPPVIRWDVRANTVEPTTLRWDFDRIISQAPAFIQALSVNLEDAFVSPDGTRQVFTGPAPGDSPRDCCAAQLRVRPVGTLEAVEPRGVTTLHLPEGIPSMPLWERVSDQGNWWVWWESNQTVLLDAALNGHSYLVRCWTTGSPCEFLFELGTGSTRVESNGDRHYQPDWEQDWTFARSPVQD